MCALDRCMCSGNPGLYPVKLKLIGKKTVSPVTRHWKQNKRMKCATNLVCMDQHHESISFTAGIFLIDKEIMDQLWSIWDEIFKVPAQNKREMISS